MATFLVTASNWNSPAFWSSISESSGGHALDFSQLPSTYSVTYVGGSDILTISDGTSTFAVGEPGVGGTDANLGGSTDWSFFSDIFGSQGNDNLTGNGGSSALYGGAGDDTLYGDSVSTADSEQLTNGDFDGDLSGWTILNPTGGQAPEYSAGSDFVRLNSGDEAAGGDGISQQFGTVVGETYSTSVDLAQNGGASGDHTVLVEVLDENGTVIDSVTTLISQGESETVTLDFVATTATSEIRITNPSSTATVNTDVVISNVSVTGLDSAAAPGDDTITGGAGDDLIVGGSGADSIDGGADNDVIYGDGNGDGDTVRESLNYEDLTTAEVRDGVTVNTGNVDVTFSSPAETDITLVTFDTASPYTGGVVDDGNGIDPNSVLQSTAGSNAALGEYGWDFSEPVTNVSFNIADLDNFENIQILAYDAEGNPIDVILTPGSNVSVGDSNGDGFDDLAEGSGSGATSSPAQAVTVTIPGPVASIEAIHTIDSSGGLGIQFTEMFFDVALPNTTDGDDIIDGGAGDDTIFGELGSDTFLLDDDYGDDVITGGEDADGLDVDTIDASAINSGGVTVTTTNESGRVVQGSDSADFTEIENFVLTDQADSFTAFSTTDVTVDAGGGDDTLRGGFGNNTLLGGDGDDIFDVGFGTDSVDGGAGTDTLSSAESGDPISVTFDGTGFGTFEDISDSDSGTFTNIEAVQGSSGADSIDASADSGGIDALGGAGADTILGGAGSDTISGGAGADTIFGQDGDDTISGGAGNDSLDGDDGLAGADSISGDAGNDTIIGDGGEDTLSGGADDDLIYAGADNDSILGGSGNDQLFGEGGNDTFVYNVGDGLDTISDFNVGNTGTLDDGDSTNNDNIDLSAFYDDIWELQDDYADDGILNQSNAGNVVGNTTVDYSNNTSFDTDGTPDNEGIVFTGQSADGSSFTQENTGVVCFAEGTLIATDRCEVPVEDLEPGDLVQTMDNGLQPVRWIGARHLSNTELAERPKLRPIRISPAVMGLPDSELDLVVSPQHRVLAVSKIAQRMLGEGEILIAANKMLGFEGVEIDSDIQGVSYYHVLCDAHEILFANGFPAESLYLGNEALKSLSPEGLGEIRALFPDLAAGKLERRPCRKIVSGNRAKNLCRRHTKNNKPLGGGGVYVSSDVEH